MIFGDYIIILQKLFWMKRFIHTRREPTDYLQKKTDCVKYKNILQQKDENIKNLQINEDNWEVIYEKLANELKITVTLATRGTSVKKII